MIKFFWREYWGYILLILAIIGAILMGIYFNDKNYWLLMGMAVAFILFLSPVIIMAADMQEKSQPTRQADKDVLERIKEIKERKERLDAMMRMTPRNRRKYIDDNDLF